MVKLCYGLKKNNDSNRPRVTQIICTRFTRVKASLRQYDINGRGPSINDVCTWPGGEGGGVNFKPLMYLHAQPSDQ